METKVTADGHQYVFDQTFAHPGGDLFLQAFDSRDITHVWPSIHMRGFPHEKMEKYLVGHVPEGADVKVRDDEDMRLFLELIKEINKVLPGIQAKFATKTFFLKTYLILALAFATEIYCHMNNYPFWAVLFCGWIFALIGLGVQHDANHGSLSSNGSVNWFFGLFQDYIGGSNIDWILHHIVLHHDECNVVGADPDANSTPLTRFHVYCDITFGHKTQHYHVWIALMLYGMSAVYHSLMGNINRLFGQTPYPKAFEWHRNVSICLKMFWIWRWIILPFSQGKYWVPLVLSAMGGLYLGTFFLISHNYVGVKHFTESHRSWFRNQVETSSNVGGHGLALLNGGLNYQIEHHLFPRICSIHYSTISPVVRKFCENHGVRYTHFPTVTENLISCFQFLKQMTFKIDKKVE